ncbi:MAG: hypothetical protein IIZ40_01890 [Bacilli bacterium]|nr:hypothetical protein [Bacilli bacterium]
MNSKRFTIVRYSVIGLAIIMLLGITIYQNREIKAEEKIIENKVNEVTEDIVLDATKVYILGKPDLYQDVISLNDFEIRVNTDDLVKEKLIDNNNNFKGYVKVLNDEGAFISVDNMLINNINDKDYVLGINNEQDLYDLKYIYVGDDPKNYIKYNDKMYRIIGITNSNDLKLIDEENTIEENFGLSGDINYLKKKEELIDEGYKGIFYVGYVRSKSNDISNIMKNEKRNNTYTVGSPKLVFSFSYPNISDIINSANECTYNSLTDININNCHSYLINMLTNTYLSNAAEKNMLYMINENNELIMTKLEKNIQVKKVIYVSALSKYLGGDGSFDNPYVIE